MPLDAAIGQVFALYCPSRRRGHRLRAQKIELWHCETAVLKLALKRHKTDPLLSSSKATSCVERSNATIQAEELSYLSSRQTLTTDKNW